MLYEEVKVQSLVTVVVIATVLPGPQRLYAALTVRNTMTMSTSVRSLRILAQGKRLWSASAPA